MAKFNVAPLAETDLAEIRHYIAERNEDAADKFIRDLAAKFELLAENPAIGKRQDDFLVEMRLFPFKNYNVYYFPGDDSGVEIYRVLHARRNIEELFGNYFEELEK